MTYHCHIRYARSGPLMSDMAICVLKRDVKFQLLTVFAGNYSATVCAGYW